MPTEGEKKSSQSSVVTVIHMEGLDKLNKVINIFIMRFICGGDLAEWSQRLTVNVVVATVLGSIPASNPNTEF